MVGKTEPQKPDVGLVALPIEDPRLEAIDDQIAELVADALYEYMLRLGLANKSKQDIIYNHEQAEEAGRIHDSGGGGGLSPAQSIYGVPDGGAG